MRRLIFFLVLLLALPVFATENLIPDGDDASDSGTTCDTAVRAVIDEDPDSPAGNCGVGGSGVDCCRADSNNVSWSFMVTMQDPSGTLDTGTDVQVIEYYVESFDEGQTGEPTIRMEIWDTTTVACDTLHETGATTTLTDAGFPAKVTDNWTAAGLSAGNDVCVKIVCTKVSGAGGARNSCDMDALAWVATIAVGGGRTRRMF